MCDTMPFSTRVKRLVLSPPPATVPIVIFTTMYLNKDAIRKLGTEVQQHNLRRGGTSLNAIQLAKSKQARASFVALTTDMQWLMPKFEKFKPSLW